MNDELKSLNSSQPEAETPAQGMSSIYRLFEAFIALREKNERQHKLFEQTLNRARDTLQGSFNAFAADTQKAYQQLKQDVQGEKRFSLALLNELLDLAIDLDHIVASRPTPALEVPGGDKVQRWMDAVAIQNRKVHDAIKRFGIHPYDAVVGTLITPPCTSVSAACVSREWMASGWRSNVSAAMPASNPNSSCAGRK